MAVRWMFDVAGFAELRSHPKLVAAMESAAHTAAPDADVEVWYHEGRKSGPRTSVQIWGHDHDELISALSRVRL